MKPVGAFVWLKPRAEAVEAVDSSAANVEFRMKNEERTKQTASFLIIVIFSKRVRSVIFQLLIVFHLQKFNPSFPFVQGLPTAGGGLMQTIFNTKTHEEFLDTD
jgi:hypothetical protein